MELFTDVPPFHFSDLLSYRAGEYSPDKVLDKIDDEHVKVSDNYIFKLLVKLVMFYFPQKLVAHMIQKDPTSRHTANEYLSQEKGRAFPEYFYHFLQSYMQIFSTEAGMMPDQKIARIHDNLPSILSMVNASPPKFDPRGLELLVTLVTSNVRSLKFMASKLNALNCLGELAQHVSNETILDRILPYVVRH